MKQLICLFIHAWWNQIRALGYLQAGCVRTYNETMSRKVKRVHVELDTHDIQSLPPEEIRTILRAADALIMQGGRSLLVKILKGSRSKDILQKGLEKLPVYSYYQHLTADEVLARIDWMIHEGYLAIEYDGRLPLIVFTPRGWELVKNTLVEEHYQNLRTALLQLIIPDMSQFKDKNREVIWLLLDKIEASGDPLFLSALQAWELVDYKKVQARIRRVIASLRGEGAVAGS